MKKRPALLSAIGFTFVMLAILGLSLTAQAAQVADVPQAPNASALRISQAYGGGGNSGAPYRNDFVELFNAGAAAVDISNWSLQYGAQAGVLGGSTGANIYVFPVSTTIPSGRYLLVQLAGGATGVTFTADLTTTIINMAGGSGKIALANTPTWLNCGGAGTLCTLPDPRIVDLVAYGNITTTAEITSVNYPTALTNAQGALRLNNGCQDTDNNFNDFSVVVSPTLSPRNSASPANYCTVPQPDLDVAKSGPDTASAGDPINYTIHISNTGTTTATATMMTDTLPAAVTFVTYTTALPASFSQVGQALIWNLGDLANGASGSITVQGVISSDLSSGTLFTNTVTASTTATEITTTNNTAPATTLIGAPDLVVVKTGSASATAGDQVAYTLNYSNTGDLNATGVVLVDQLPAGLTYVTDSLGSGVQVGGRVTWTLGTVPINATGSVVLTVTASGVGDQANVATIGGSTADSNPQNNTSVFTTTVLGSDPFVTKSAPAVVFGGELITYTIVYGNHGSAPADVTLTDTLPISFTTSDIAFDDGPPNPIDNTNTRSWTATLAAGDRFTFTLVLTAPTSIANNTRITNTLAIATASLGNNPIDDLSTASSTVYQLVPISVARAGSVGQLFAVEGRVTYVPGTYNLTGWALQDNSGGIAVFYTPVPSVTLGDRVRLVATRGNNRGEEQLSTPVPYSQTLGSGPEVTPLPFTTGQIASGNTQGWLSVITGTISGLGACSSNYQFNIDDGSGAAVVFVDADTAINVCTLGAVNGGPISVIGYSTEFTQTTPPTITYEVKPRRPADVKLLYQVTFVYHDVEDVVHAGDEVQLRGDFTNWDTTPITMSHDAGYVIFTATVVLPTNAVQNYRYFVPAAGANGYTWLNNYADRLVAPTANITVKDDYRLVQPNAAALLGPASMMVDHGTATPALSATLFITGVTDFDGSAGRGLKAEVGYGTSANLSTWTWSPLTFLAKSAGSDVYSGGFTPTLTGIYSYAVRFNANAGTGNPMGSAWTYTDLDGLPFSVDRTGVLTVTAPQLAINKTVVTANAEVQLGEVVTYTFTLSNTGTGAATSVLITDVLPTAVTFGGFVQQNGATFNSGAITWSGSLNVNAAATVVFTATVKNDQALYGTDVLNTVQYTSGNGGSSSANIAFAVVKHYFIYMPLIKR